VGLSVFAAALLGLCLLAAGCGGSAGSHVAQFGTGTTQSGGSTYDHAVAFTRCMRMHGVPLWPEPGPNGSFAQSPITLSQLGVSKSQVTSAQQACRSLLPTHSVTSQGSYVLAQALRFSQCMRTRGVGDFPDPDSNGAIKIPQAMENESAYPAALHFCIGKYGVPPPPSSAKG
jgi:hypothetical protein